MISIKSDMARYHPDTDHVWHVDIVFHRQPTDSVHHPNLHNFVVMFVTRTMLTVINHPKIK